MPPSCAPAGPGHRLVQHHLDRLKSIRHTASIDSSTEHSWAKIDAREVYTAGASTQTVISSLATISDFSSTGIDFQNRMLPSRRSW